MSHSPIVLCIGGHDPSGGAGIQADIESVAALGGRAVTLVTALTTQDTHDIRDIDSVPADTLGRQLATLWHDIRPDAVKTGLFGDSAQLGPVVERLRGFDGPVVVDPVLAAGGGFAVDGGGLAAALREQLLPLATLVTPNRAEARRLAGIDDADAAAGRLLAAGAAAVLLTGADESHGDSVVNRLFSASGTRDFTAPHLPGRFHGSGCTLASACATCLALGMPLADAITRAQAFTIAALERATRPGGGQALPRRLP
ncbi:MAG: hydroxymethylpyrimidine/phosphomethylpyrimidine kinase [Gammaproteobacteria bacterium]|nr:hydroxymethylpyrimidine/phosphomethylpyrimidine kinase [Gammaproteobacteria bacterium]